MPFVFLLLGVGMLAVAVRGTHQQAFALIKSEFTGSNSFVVWALALFVLGGLGYIQKIRPIADGMVLLVLLVIFLTNNRPGSTGGGFFAQLNAQIRNPAPAAPAPSGVPNAAPPGALGSPLPPLPPIQTPGQPVTTPQGNTCIPGGAFMQWFGLGRC